MITVEDFKTYFKRYNIPFLPVWSADVFYNTGEKVYYEITRLFYQANKNGVTSVPTTTEDWTLLEGEDINDYVSDDDIERAMGEMKAMLPEHLFDEETLRLAQLYLTAHCLLNDLRTAMSGLASQFPFPLQSRSVGSVSESYGIPAKFLNDPTYSFYITSQFGLKYLAMLLPRLVGNIGIAYGATLP